MITAACPRCVVNGRPGLRWQATGRFNTSRRNIPRAHLVCSTCQYGWSSGCMDAIEAGAWAWLANFGDDAVEPVTPIVVPQPSLVGMQIAPTAQPFVTPRNFAQKFAVDVKARAAGEDVA